MRALEVLKAFTSNTPFAYDSVMRTEAATASKTFASLDEWMDEEW